MGTGFEYQLAELGRAMRCRKMEQYVAVVILFMHDVGISFQDSFQFRQQFRFGTIHRYILNAYIPCMSKVVRGSQLARKLEVIRRHCL